MKKHKPKRKRKRVEMAKFREKRLVKYACLVANETTTKELRDYLGQEIDFADHYLDTWKKYD